MENQTPEYQAQETQQTEAEQNAQNTQIPEPVTAQIYTPASAPKKSFAIAGMILGIASVALGYESWYLGVAAGIVGLILSLQAKKSYEALGQKNGMATAGFILSIVGLGLSALGLVACITCGGCLSAIGTGALASGLVDGQIPDNAMSDLSSALDEAGSALKEAASEVSSIL